jgi:hypothetical protein
MSEELESIEKIGSDIRKELSKLRDVNQAVTELRHRLIALLGGDMSKDITFYLNAIAMLVSDKKELVAALPDPDKLEILAQHFDLQDLIDGCNKSEVQDELRRWATSARELKAKHS